MSRPHTSPGSPGRPPGRVERARVIPLTSQLLLPAALILSGCCGDQSPRSAGWVAAARASPAKMVGVLDAADCQSIRGWAWDPKRPDEPIKVDIYDGDQLLTTLVADQYRDDLKDVGLGNGRHTFEMDPPPKLRDGTPHPIRAKFAGTPHELNVSPRTFICTEEDTAPPSPPVQPPAEK